MQESLPDFDSQDTSKESPPDTEASMWPDTLPDELQRSQYPPVASNDPLVETGPASQIRVGDVDCYQNNEVGPFGFIVLQSPSEYSEEVGVYAIHTQHYTTFSLEAFTDIPENCKKDPNGNLNCGPTRKIYTEIVES